MCTHALCNYRLRMRDEAQVPISMGDALRGSLYMRVGRNPSPTRTRVYLNTSRSDLLLLVSLEQAKHIIISPVYRFLAQGPSLP